MYEISHVISYAQSVTRMDSSWLETHVDSSWAHTEYSAHVMYEISHVIWYAQSVTRTDSSWLEVRVDSSWAHTEYSAHVMYMISHVKSTSLSTSTLSPNVGVLLKYKNIRRIFENFSRLHKPFSKVSTIVMVLSSQKSAYYSMLV